MKPNPGLFNNNEQNKQKEQNKNTNSLFSNDKENNTNTNTPFNNKNESIFNSMITKNDEPEKKKEEQKIVNDTKKDEFFGTSSNYLFNSKDGMNSLFKVDNNQTNNLFKTQPSNVKEGIFNQNNPISQAMNEQPLFNSNRQDNNTRTSLFNNNNTFIKNGNGNINNVPSLFGGDQKNDNNLNLQSNNSLFGNTPFSFGANNN